MQFRGQLTYGVTNELANIGGYVDSTGREYALVGCQTGLSIVDVTNPGEWMMHCHIAEHLESGMMTSFVVSEDGKKESGGMHK